MSRIVVFLILAFLIWLVFRGFFRARARRDGEAAPRGDKVEDMVACARCGVNLPKSDAQAQGALFYCRDNPRCIAQP